MEKFIKNTKQKHFISWNEYTFFLKEDSILNNKTLKIAINNFFQNRIENQKDFGDKHIAILVRVGTPMGIIRTLNSLIKLNTGPKDKDYLYTQIQSTLELIQGGYSDIEIDKIIFSYGIYHKAIEINYNNSISTLHKNVPLANYNNYKVPVVSPLDDPLKFGNLISTLDLASKEDIDKGIINRVYNFQMESISSNYIMVKSTGDNTYRKNKVSIYKNGNPILEFVDVATFEDTNWLRIIKKRHYVYDSEGKQLLMSQDKQIRNFIMPKLLSEPENSNFVTLDIETYKEPSSSNEINKFYGKLHHSLIPYLISYYDGISKYYFHSLDYDSPESMIQSALKSLKEYHTRTGLINMEKYNQEYERYLKEFNAKVMHLDEKIQLKAEPKKKRNTYANLNVYVHNFGLFDATFLLSNIISLFTVKNVEPVLNKQNRLISVKVKFKVKFKEGDKDKSMVFTITFLDSYLILPSSLAILFF